MNDLNEVSGKMETLLIAGMGSVVIVFFLYVGGIL